MQALWDSFTHWWPYGDRALVAFCFFIGHSFLSLPFNFISLALHTWPNKVVNQWKIQKDKYPAPRLVKDVVRHVLLDHLIISPIMGAFVVYPVFSWLEMPIRAPIPSIGTILLHFLIFIVVNDCLFYWTHRALHSHPWIYKTFHSQHHRFTSPISWAAEYSSTTESILSGSIPTIAGCFILRSHLFVITVWLMFRMLETLDAHSGFHFPFAPWRIADSIMLGPEGHDWHHSHNRGNYGVLKFWDWLCGTDIEYKRWLRGEPTTPFENSRSNPIKSQ